MDESKVQAMGEVYQQNKIIDELEERENELKAQLKAVRYEIAHHVLLLVHKIGSIPVNRSVNDTDMTSEMDF